MPFCPSCRFEYREGISRCRECGVELVAELPPEQAQSPVPTPETELVELCRIRDPNRLAVLQAALREAGIAALLRTHGVLTAYQVAPERAQFDDVMLYVTRNRLEEAQVILQAVQGAAIVWPEGMEAAEGEDEEADEGEEAFEDER